MEFLRRTGGKHDEGSQRCSLAPTIEVRRLHQHRLVCDLAPRHESADAIYDFFCVLVVPYLPVALDNEAVNKSDTRRGLNA